MVVFAVTVREQKNKHFLTDDAQEALSAKSISHIRNLKR